MTRMNHDKRLERLLAKRYKHRMSRGKSTTSWLACLGLLMACSAPDRNFAEAAGGSSGQGGAPDQDGASGKSGSTSSDGGVATDGPPAAPVVALEYGIKQVRLSWPSVSGAFYYRVHAAADSRGEFRQLGEDLPWTSEDVSLDLAVFRHDWAGAAYRVDACNEAGCTASDVANTRGGSIAAMGYFKASNAGTFDTFGAAVALSEDGTTLAVGAPLEDSAATGVDGSQTEDTSSDSGAVYVFTRSGSGWVQQAYLKASNTGAQDQFGRSLALSADGQTLVVGAPQEGSAATGIDGAASDDTAENAGAVYVFARSGASWSQQAYVKASNTAAGDRFGATVALSGDGHTLAVGAPGEDSAATTVHGDEADNSALESGAVYLFARSGAAWSQQVYVKASNTDADDGFASALALSADGNTLAVGAPAEASAATGIDGDGDDDTADNAGAVYVFARPSSGWVQQAYVKASNAGAHDHFGHSVSLSADGATLAVGAPFEDSRATGVDGTPDEAAFDSGAAYVFTRRASEWSEQAFVKSSNTGVEDYFGWPVALSADGQVLAVAAAAEDGAGTGVGAEQQDGEANSGAAYVFVREASGWSQVSYAKASNTDANDGFGHDLALSGDGQTLAVGAQREASSATGIGGEASDNAAAEAGAVYLY